MSTLSPISQIQQYDSIGEDLFRADVDAGVKAWLSSVEAGPIPLPVATTTISGWNMLDLSRYDANKGDGTYIPIDWSLAKTRWGGGIVKGGQGIYQDSAYATQVRAMKTAQVQYGTYWFFDATVNAIQQAQLCASVVSQGGGYGDLGVWMDLESVPAGMSAASYMSYAACFLNEMKKAMSSAGALAMPLGIYSRNSLIDPLVAQAGAYWVENYPYWQALYATTWSNYGDLYTAIMSGYIPPKPSPSLYLGTCVIWQWTDLGKPADVPGYPPYKKAVDFNVAYVEQVPVPPPTEPPPSVGLRMEVLPGITALNIRLKPSTSSAVLGTLTAGDVVTPVDVSGVDAWVKFEYQPGKFGWSAVITGGKQYMRPKP
jgi:GH25 family lysozyme M1 (1,4-beta-N-acetylmuramidase)